MIFEIVEGFLRDFGCFLFVLMVFFVDLSGFEVRFWVILRWFWSLFGERIGVGLTKKNKYTLIGWSDLGWFECWLKTGLIVWMLVFGFWVLVWMLVWILV